MELFNNIAVIEFVWRVSMCIVLIYAFVICFLILIGKWKTHFVIMLAAGIVLIQYIIYWDAVVKIFTTW